MTDRQRDSINARARELYATDSYGIAEGEAFRAGATFALSLIQDDRLFEASKAAMQGLIANGAHLQTATYTVADNAKCENTVVIANVSVGFAKALLAVLEEEGK